MSGYSPCVIRRIRNYCEEGRLRQAVGFLSVLARGGIRLDARNLAFLLQQCLRSRAIALARQVNLHMKLMGLKNSIPGITFLANQVLALHFECGRPKNARQLFDRMPKKNVFTYNAMISGYSKLGLVTCARDIFEGICDGDRDVVSWNIMIMALARCGRCCEAVEFYCQMRRSLGNVLNQYSFSGLLCACVRLKRRDIVQETHGQVLVIGYLSNLIISSSIVDAYAKCGHIDEARKVFSEISDKDVLTWTILVTAYAKSGDLASARILFNEMPERNNFSWNAMLKGYAQNGQSSEALSLIARMLREGLSPDQFCISSALSACSSASELSHGRQILALLTRTLSDPSSLVNSSLKLMYSSCESFEKSERIFELTSYRERNNSFME